jgi:hypothetical protein
LENEERRIEICVRLLDEGTEVARPTEAVCLPGDLFKLLPVPGYDPNDERWEFQPGSIVAAQLQTWSSGQILLAVKPVVTSRRQTCP